MWPVVALLVVFFGTTLPLIMGGGNIGRYAWDQVNYHEKVIRTFTLQWPSPDVSNYLSATTPLYHFVLAAVGKFISDSPAMLQFTGMLFSLGLMVTFALSLARQVTAVRVFIFTLVLMSSLYVFPAAVWMLPDNAAWWGVLGVLLIAWRCRFDMTLVVGGGVLMVLLVLTRQSHLWAAAALWASAWMSLDARRPHPHQSLRSPLGKVEEARRKAGGPPAPQEKSGVAAGGSSVAHDGDDEALPKGTLRRIFTHPGRRFARTFVMVLATLPAFAIVAWFRHVWGGRLYPPVFDIQLKYPPNFSTPVFIFAVFGAINVFFAGFLLPRLAVLWRYAPMLAIGIAVAMVGVACLAPTSLSEADGRFGALWTIGAKFPLVQERSLLIIALAVWGGFALLGWCAALQRGPRIVVLVALAGFIAAQSIGHLAFQRYCEPMLLILTLLLAARTPEWPGPKWLHPFKTLGPALLAILMGAYTAADLRRAKPVVDEGTSLQWVPGLPGHAQPARPTTPGSP